MNHLESAVSGRNNFWRYIVMIAAVLAAANTIGSVPLLLTIAIKSSSTPGISTQLAANPSDFSVLGLNPIVMLIMMICPFIAGLLAFIILVKPMNNRTFRMTINGTAKIRWNRFFISAAVWLMLSALYLFFYLKLDPLDFRINNTSSSLIILSLVTILLIPFQAAFEEVIFRGYLMQGFYVLIKNRWFPLIMTSILFGLLHAFNPEVREYGFFTMMPQYIVFGLIFGIVTIFDDGIEATMGAHAANNIFLCIMLTSESSALKTPAIYAQSGIHPWLELAVLTGLGIIFIVVLKMIFKWDKLSIIFKNSPR